MSAAISATPPKRRTTSTVKPSPGDREIAKTRDQADGWDPENMNRVCGAPARRPASEHSQLSFSPFTPAGRTTTLIDMRRSKAIYSPEIPDNTEYVTSAGRSRNMSSIRRRDTKPEIELRSQLHRRGFRFRKDHAIRVDGRLIRPDIAFTRRRLAIFIDGCFWHSCPQHGRKPSVNQDYWSPKLDGNSNRDIEQTAALQSAGWTVLRFWEHEDLIAVIDSITAAMR